MDINLKQCSPALMKKYRVMKDEIKLNGLTTKLVVNSLFETMLDEQIKQGFPIIKKIKKLL